MNKKIYILLIAFGFFLIPNAIFACNSSAQIETSKKVISSHHELEDNCEHSHAEKVNHNCCDKKSSKESNNNQCNGKCGHSSCTVSMVNFALISNNINEIAIDNNFSFSNKVNFSYLKTNLTDGFYSLWLIPKIG